MRTYPFDVHYFDSVEMSMIEKPIDEFLDDLASRAPTPGGGSAAAIMGAMGAALVSMVCNLTIGKKDYESVEGDIKSALADAERLRSELADMVRSDVEAFDQVMGAYRLPKDSGEQKQARTAAIQQALKAATDVPMACARLCGEVIRLSRIVADKGNRNVVSDAGVAVMAAYGALKGAALNVYTNTGSIRDESFVESRLGELEQLLAQCEAVTQDIFADVKNKL